MTKKIPHTNINDLKQQVADLSGVCCDESESALPILNVTTACSQASICLQGAHLLSWRPKGEDDVIWMSSQARPLPGKSLRGGIPVCWPWFGAHESEAAYPAHGFARTVMWQLHDVRGLSKNETQVILTLDMHDMDQNIQAMWPYDCVLEYIITVGKTLKLKLVTHNKSSQAFNITQALHSYFNVQDVKKTHVVGLDGLEYLDKPDAFKRKKQKAEVSITAEVDRIYLQTPSQLSIHTPSRKIHLSSQGSQSTVVWNPWKDVAEKMGDLGDDGYLKMLCVETANAADDVISIAAGEQQELIVEYSLDKK